MVGPAIEEQAQVRHASRMFVASAHLRVPFFGVVLRKGYGLGAPGSSAGWPRRASGMPAVRR